MTKMKDNQFLSIIDSTPLISIDLILEDGNGNTLLGKRNNRPAQGFWFVPGGRVRKNESLAEAFKRISHSELGTALKIEQATPIGTFDHIYEDNFAGVENINTHYVALGYKINVDEQFVVRLDEQHSETKWWPLNKLLDNEQVHVNTKRYFEGVRSR